MVFVCVYCAPWLAFVLRGALPEHHLSADTKDTVRITMALVATMAAVMLGLLVASVNDSYDTQKEEEIAMSAKVAYFDRLLARYGPEAAPARTALRHAIELMVVRVWPGKVAQTAGLKPSTGSAEALYHAVQNLAPRTDEQRALKTQARASVYELGQLPARLQPADAQRLASDDPIGSLRCAVFSAPIRIANRPQPPMLTGLHHG